MNESIYKRMFKLIIDKWPYLFASTITSLFYVTLNSLSIWLTASLINNILIDFSDLILEQHRLSTQEALSLNEQLKFWVNGLILRDTPKATLKVLCLTIMSVFLIKNIFLYLKNLLMALVQFHLITNLRNRLYAHFNSLSISYFNKKKSGELTALMINDVNNVNRALGMTFHQILIEPINIIAFTALLFIISWKLAVLSVVVVPVAGVTIIFIGRSIRRKSRRTAEQFAGITNIITETFSSIRVVKAFGMEMYEVKRFLRETRKYFSLLLRQSRLWLLSSPITETLGVMMGVLLLWVGGLQVLSGTGLTSEDFLRFILLLFATMGPLQKLSNVNVELQTGAASAERIFVILDTPPAITDVENAITIDHFKTEIRFNRVSFQYEESNEKTLDDINCVIKKGSVVAIVGPSGAGKTTLVDLIPRFYDVTKGEIAIDDQDIRSLTLTSLRAQMGIVTQETFLFNDTLKANIAYGQKEIDDRKVVAAAQAANALAFIERLPAGLQTVIGEKGVKLSGGQRQRIAIARAIMKNPPILILDEATSSLDTESEKLVQEAIENLMADRTVLVIAHRLSTVRNADVILVMENGKIVETGTHTELMDINGVYKKLYGLQFQNI